LSYSPMQES